jgi:hypothetical protein
MINSDGYKIIRNFTNDELLNVILGMREYIKLHTSTYKYIPNDVINEYYKLQKYCSYIAEKSFYQYDCVKEAIDAEYEYKKKLNKI